MADFADCHAVSTRTVTFYNNYIKLLDKKEERSKIPELYFILGQDKVLEWNGHVIQDKAGLMEYVQNLPTTKHVMDCLDAQPLPGNQGADMFMMTASGTVTYDDEHVRTYFERLIIREDSSVTPKRFYIINHYYRWTGEKSEC
eukprot:Tbor_TRINITY_DN5775_c4_g3::TRINITY_DN5775_c4_g3_i1::g.20355::m.20355/K14285/NXT1_2, P15; NTF2-related export protein 1/2